MNYSPETEAYLQRIDYHQVKRELAERGYRVAIISDQHGDSARFCVTDNRARCHLLLCAPWSKVMQIHSTTVSKSSIDLTYKN